MEIGQRVGSGIAGMVMVYGIVAHGNAGAIERFGLFVGMHGVVQIEAHLAMYAARFPVIGNQR